MSVEEKITEKKEIFSQLRALISEYQNVFKPKYDDESNYDLWSFKNIEIMGRKYKSVYFAGIIERKNYVGLYYMPFYVDDNFKLEPPLLKMLKGKSCFHIKYLDDELRTQIKDALAAGYKLYEERDWV